MFRFLILLAVAVLLFSSMACSRNKKEAVVPIVPASNQVTVPAPLPEVAAPQNTEFSFRIWEQIDTPGANLFLSPYSINTAMGMAYSGARGNTADEIAKVMAYTLPPEHMHEVFYKSMEMLNSLQSRKEAEFNLANALFNAESNKDRLLQSYQEILQKSFSSELFSLDFGKAKDTAEFINIWVEKQTNSRIRDIVSESQIQNSNDGMVLVNAIYFKSNWNSQFQEENTVIERFYTTSARSPEQHKVMPMMKQTGSFGYAEVEDAKLLEMPYAEREIVMLFVIPKDIEASSRELSPKLWQHWMESISTPRKVEVEIPKFRLETTLDKLVDNFRELGIRDAFEAGSADFSGILKMDGGRDLYISDIVHKAFLEVVEKGTEAAAATQIGFAKTSIGQPVTDVPVFRADQPFFCAIVHKPTNEILFFGKVVNPDVVK